MNKRTIYSQLMEALSDTPVVFLRGARQTGKTTLVKQLAEESANAGSSRQYISLDSATALAGRMEVLTLYPLSQGEIAGTQEDFINALFQKDFPLKGTATTPLPKEKLLEAIVLGGYPEVLSRSSPKRRAAWFDSYITTLVERDIRDISNVQDISGLIRLLRLLGVRSGTLHNLVRLFVCFPEVFFRRHITRSCIGGELLHLHLRPGWEYLHVCVDDASRVAYTAVLPDETAESAVEFLWYAVAWYASHGIKVERVLTDNGACYKSWKFREACKELGIKHKRTRPYRPQANGKAERFIKTALKEWAYKYTYTHSWKRTVCLPVWTHRYNFLRPHTALGRKLPASKLNGG